MHGQVLATGPQPHRRGRLGVVERVGVVVDGEPAVGVFGVLERFGRVIGWGPRAEPRSDVLVCVDPADVLGRAGSRAAQTSRLTVARRQGVNRLQCDSMLPAVALVVQVLESISRRAENLIQVDAVLASSLLTLFLVELGDEVWLVVAPPDARLEAV